MTKTNFNSCSDEEILRIVKKDYRAEFNFDQQLKQRILRIDSIWIYQQVISSIQKNNAVFADEIEQEKDQMLDELIKAFSGKKIDFFNGGNALKDIKNIICYRYFKDNYKNVVINCREMINFLKSIDEELIDKEMLSVYRTITNIDNMLTEELIKFYEKLAKLELKIKRDGSNMNLMQAYYDDYKSCTNCANEMLCEALTDFDQDEEAIVTEDGFVRHDLKGQPFGVLVNCGKIRPFFEKVTRGVVRKNETATCMTYLSERFTKSDRKGVRIGFKKQKLKPENIITMNPDDVLSNSKGMDVFKILTTNVILTPKDLARRSVEGGHNEILYRSCSNDEKYKDNELNQMLDVLEPAYIICYNEIHDDDLTEAREIEKSFGVKLEFIVIHEEMYPESKQHETYKEEMQRKARYDLVVDL